MTDLYKELHEEQDYKADADERIRHKMIKRNADNITAVEYELEDEDAL